MSVVTSPTARRLIPTGWRTKDKRIGLPPEMDQQTMAHFSGLCRAVTSGSVFDYANG
jgi:hypothetical protein